MGEEKRDFRRVSLYKKYQINQMKSTPITIKINLQHFLYIRIFIFAFVVEVRRWCIWYYVVVRKLKNCIYRILPKYHHNITCKVSW